MNLNEILEKYKTTRAIKITKADWIVSSVKTPLSKNVVVNDWNNLITDLYRLSNDSDAVATFINEFTQYVSETYATNTTLEDYDIKLSNEISELRSFIQRVQSTLSEVKNTANNTASRLNTHISEYGSMLAAHNTKFKNLEDTNVELRNSINGKQAKLNASSEALYGFDESGNPTIYHIAKTIGATVNGIPTAKVINETLKEYASTQALSQVEDIAKGAVNSLVFYDYTDMCQYLQGEEKPYFKVGDHIYLIATEIPDLWVNYVGEGKVPFYPNTNKEFLDTLKANPHSFVDTGYYSLSALETQKVDLTNYATKKELETGNTNALNSATAYTDAQIKQAILDSWEDEV